MCEKRNCRIGYVLIGVGLIWLENFYLNNNVKLVVIYWWKEFEYRGEILLPIKEGGGFDLGFDPKLYRCIALESSL
jgi:hypothetical protein